MLSQGELRQLATQLEQVNFPDTGVAIISEGEIGREMYANTPAAVSVSLDSRREP